MFEPKKDESSLDSLKKRLYTRSSFIRRPLRKGRLEAHGDNVEESWHPETVADIYPELPKKEKIKMGLFKKFFIGSAIFFVLAILYASYQFFVGGNLVSSKNIDITVIGPAFSSGGDELSLQVSIENRNSVPLEFAKLFIEYPKGASNLNSSTTPDMVRKSIPLPKISAGGINQQVVKVTLYGEEGSQQAIKFMLEYRVQGSNAIFRKESPYQVRISSAPINLDLEAPRTVNSSQEFILKINISSNAPKDVPGVLLSVDYPSGFAFKDANPKPAYGNNVWKLGDLHTGSSRLISVTGALSGEDGEERTVRILSGSASSDDEKTIGVIYNSVFRTISIQRPFLDAQVYLNGDSGDSVTIYPDEEVKGLVVWKNNLPTRIVNASISVKFSGSAFDRTSVSGDRGFYNSLDNTIVWDKNNVTDFVIIEPGETGKISFTFRPLPLFSSGKGIISKPEVSLSTKVTGEVNVSGGGSNGESATVLNVAKVSTGLQLLGSATYSVGPFKNTGPIPPVADLETTYTVTWNVRNSSNDVTGAVVTTTLPPYVKWFNRIYPEDEDLSYDENTKTVTWRIGTISAGVGYGSLARETSFQVKLVPSLSHVGSSVRIINETAFSGTDTFAGILLKGSKIPLTTRMNNDPGFKPNDDIVVSPE